MVTEKSAYIPDTPLLLKKLNTVDRQFFRLNTSELRVRLKNSGTRRLMDTQEHKYGVKACFTVLKSSPE